MHALSLLCIIDKKEIIMGQNATAPRGPLAKIHDSVVITHSNMFQEITALTCAVVTKIQFEVPYLAMYSMYNLGRSIGREVLKMRIWVVPLACLGSR